MKYNLNIRSTKTFPKIDEMYLKTKHGQGLLSNPVSPWISLDTLPVRDPVSDDPVNIENIIIRFK